MPDSYSLDDSEDVDPSPSRRADGAAVRAVAWVVLVVTAAGNSVASSVGAAIGVHLALGVVSAICVAVLVAQWLRPRPAR